MRIIRARDYDELSRKAAAFIGAQVLLKPACVLGLATGSTPLGTYQRLIRWHREDGLDFSGITTVNLDEYVGLGPESDQSYRWFMQQNLFDHINVDPEKTFVPNGLATDIDEECRRYDSIIRYCGGIDLQLLGLGNNGHIGFNEPGDAFEADTHQVALAQSTIDANQRFFQSPDDVPRRAITMGIGAIMQAKRVLVIVSGGQKAAIVKKALQGPVTPAVPASILQLHRDATLIGDEEALAQL